jgi:hypothetical protein
VKLWIADLDHPQFNVRETALRELRLLGDLAEPAVRQTLASNVPLEVRRRLERLLDYRQMFVQPESLRRRRSVQVLENIRTEAARTVLRALAAGDAAATLTREAGSALRRLER